MHRKFLATSAVGVLLLGAAMGMSKTARGVNDPPGIPASNDCDRACLNGFIDQYLKALAARDPSHLSVTKNVRFTENSAPLSLGDGLWQTITGVGAYRIYCDEPSAGEVGSINVIQENSLPAIMMLRLKVIKHQISEIETIIVRSQGEANEEEAAHTDKLVAPDPVFQQDAPDQPSREELVSTANKYFEGIVQTNGKMIPYADNGYRILTGTLDCNDAAASNIQQSDNSSFSKMTCTDQIDTGRFKYITSISPRRFPVVDREKGLVLALIRFNHAGNVLSIHLTDGTVLDMTKDAWAQHPTSALMAELFKIEKGKIRIIWGVYTRVPYKDPVGWDGE